MRGIFISYRREDTAGYAGRLYDRLANHFGPQRVFMDVEGIEPGVDFVDAIEQAVASCEALIVLIGEGWLAADGAGKRRLDDPADFVRIETGAALARGIRVVPVLVEGAAMPRAADLPTEMAALARRQAVEIGHKHWDAGCDELIRTLEKVLATGKGSSAAAAPGADARGASGSMPERTRAVGGGTPTAASEAARKDVAGTGAMAEASGSSASGSADVREAEVAPARSWTYWVMGGAAALAVAVGSYFFARPPRPVEKVADTRPSPTAPQPPAPKAEPAEARPELPASIPPPAPKAEPAVAKPEPPAATPAAPPKATPSVPAKSAVAPKGPAPASSAAAPARTAAAPARTAAATGARTAPVAATPAVAAPSTAPSSAASASATPSAGAPPPAAPPPAAPPTAAPPTAAPPTAAPPPAASSAVTPSITAPAATAAAAAASATPAPPPPSATAAGMALAALPRAGDFWEYRFRGVWKTIEPRTYTHQVVAVSEREIRESMRADAAAELPVQSKSFGPDTGFVEWQGKGHYYVEFNPYLAAFGGVPAPGTTWKRYAMPTTDSGLGNWTSQGRVADWGSVSVPAGTFRALRIEISATRTSTGPASMRATEPVRLLHVIWYAPDVKRTVKAVRTVHSVTQTRLDEDTWELVKYRVQ